eukprot:PhM_4_TR15001/c0_g2_i1/m.3550
MSHNPFGRVQDEHQTGEAGFPQIAPRDSASNVGSYRSSLSRRSACSIEELRSMTSDTVRDYIQDRVHMYWEELPDGRFSYQTVAYAMGHILEETMNATPVQTEANINISNIIFARDNMPDGFTIIKYYNRTMGKTPDITPYFVLCHLDNNANQLIVAVGENFGKKCTSHPYTLSISREDRDYLLFEQVCLQAVNAVEKVVLEKLKK